MFLTFNIEKEKEIRKKNIEFTFNFYSSNANNINKNIN